MLSSPVQFAATVLLMALSIGTWAAPVEEAVAEAPSPHCGSIAVNQDEVTAALWDFQSHSRAGSKYWPYGDTSAHGYSPDNVAQFFICNNAASKRYFTLDTPALNEMLGYFQQCGSQSFWVMHDDHWSYGVDLADAAECGGF
jgi:hypothetical protein